MVDKREKTISYRRAEWTVQGFTLEKCIRSANKALKTVDARSVFHGDQIIKVAKARDVTAGGLLLHLTTEKPGEAASVVPKASPSTIEVDLKKQKPPADGEWLDGDAFLYVKDNHICLCTTDVRDRAVRTFFYRYFEKAKIQKESTRFDFFKVADISKIKLLHKLGVKELEIRASLYKATADYEKRKNNVIGLAGWVGKQVRIFLGKQHDVTPDGLRVCLAIRTDRRSGKRALALGESRIETLATDVVKNDGGEDYDYVIVTNSGQRITQEEIFMRTKVEIETDGKTVRCDKTWKELTTFFESLEEVGALEQ